MLWLEKTLSQILKLGVKDFCLCAGKRNAAIIAALQGVKGARLYHHYEERSAGFFALGLTRKYERPVAVVTTSGTAVGELLPAIMEAHYTNTPLIAITADRPKSYRGSGAPQACMQKDIYGTYAQCIDLEEGNQFNTDWDLRSPLQINICLEEPENLTAANLSVQDPSPQSKLGVVDEGVLTKFLGKAKRPLVMVGTLKESERASVKTFLQNLGAALYIEAPSGLREDAELQHSSIRHPEHFHPDAVLKLGGVPTTRFWRDIGNLPLLSLSETLFCGAPSGTHYQVDLTTLPRISLDVDFADFKRRDDDVSKELVKLLESEPLSEPGIIYSLSKKVRRDESIFVGNSMPIREWDLAADLSTTSSVYASRGVNGIDGQISTALGIEADYILLGDLTALYDLSGLWLLSQVSHKVKIIVVNNSGGQIFKHVGLGDHFINPHTLNFEGAAKLWGLNYSLWDGKEMPYGLIEAVPDVQATERFWNEKKHLSARLSRQAL